MYLSCGIVITLAYTKASVDGGKYMQHEIPEKFPPVKINGSGAIGIEKFGCSLLL
jgi:hypothetical protein